MTIIAKNGSHLIDPGGDFLETLKNCEGYYARPMGPDGTLRGPVVGYTACYEPGKHWVGHVYLNFAQADPWPTVLTFFAEEMALKLKAKWLVPDVILGAPWAGVKFSQEVARLLGCRHIFAEKKVVGVDEDGVSIEEIILGRYVGMIKPGDVVGIGEELVNNASTTGKLIRLIEEAGGHVNVVTCAINRSSPLRTTIWNAPVEDPIPIVGVIEQAIPQYRQDDPSVKDEIASGNVVWKPKYAWPQLKAAMDATY